jgi:hypothetical protein
MLTDQSNKEEKEYAEFSTAGDQEGRTLMCPSLFWPLPVGNGI